MKLLLHVCCAPCAIYPVEAAKADGYDVTVNYFYNPNIHPLPEFNKRYDNVKKFLAGSGLDVISEDYSPSDYFGNVKDFDNPAERCASCWELRVGRTAEKAAEDGFDAFSTTLLGSPYQDHGVLKVLCEAAAARNGVKFYYRDFREGFKEAHEKAHARGIYCQNYCGCVFSIMEREERRMNRKKKAKS